VQHAKRIAERRDALGVKVMATTPPRTCLTWLMENCCCLMTIAYPTMLLRGGRFGGSCDCKS
jgi:hypothetical protein